MSLWEERAGRNEALFREVNENIARAEEWMDSGSNWFSVFCECAQEDCTTRIEILLGEYTGVRGYEHRFIVVPGHEQPEIEQVVETHPEYVVVEKRGQAAEAADDAAS